MVYEVDNNRRRFLDAKVSVREVSVGEGSLVVEKEDIFISIGVGLDIKIYRSLS